MSIKYLHLLCFASSLLLTTTVQAQRPTSAAMNFNVFVKGNTSLMQHESEGPIAIGGNLTTSQYQISFDSKLGVYKSNNSSIALAVKGGVKLGSGSLQINGNNFIKIGQCTPSNSDASDLKVWYKDQNNATSNIRITKSKDGYDGNPNISINANINMFTNNGTPSQVCDNSIFGTGAGQIDMDGAFTKLTAGSAQLSALTDNLAIRDQNGNVKVKSPVGPYLNVSDIDNNPKIIVDPNKINVLTVSAEVWNSIQNANVEGIPQGFQAGEISYSGKFGLIINIVNFPAFAAKNNKIRFPQFGGLASSQGSYVVYNFPDATETITLTGSTEINGTILAPNANLIKEGSNNINGQVIAKTFVHNGGEIHFFPFLPTIAEPVVKKLTVAAESKCFKNAPYLDYTVTANFPTTGESAKIEWINAAGKVIYENNSQPMKGSILFPGAAVSNEGAGVAWPGWALQGSKWVKVTDIFSSILEPGAKIKVTVTASETVSISYPTSSSTCTAAPISAGPLPVTLASFTAEKVNCNVQLKWKVSEAKNFSHFEVQRSADAKNYTSLSRINFVEGNKEYTYVDSPFSGESTAPSKFFYYRLQQVDMDESIDYSSIRSVEAGQCDTRLAVDFYPNPTQDEINVKSYSPIKMMEIVTVGGKRVYQMPSAANVTDFKVNVQALAQGLYIVNIVNNEGKYSSKILKK